MQIRFVHKDTGHEGEIVLTEDERADFHDFGEHVFMCDGVECRLYREKSIAMGAILDRYVVSWL